MSGFFSELQRRHVYKVGATYVIAGWLLVQIVTQVFPIFHIGETAQRVIVLAVIVGFPVTLALAWIFDITPLGIVRTDEQPTDEAAASAPHRRNVDRILNYVLGALLLSVLGYFALDRWFLSHGPEDAPVINAPSIAVLPFTDMSQSADQGYFSDGISEELLNLLAQAPELHVAGRTSSFSFRGKPATIAEIGKALNVNTVLEGSVRKSGDRLRVTAQLINVADGYHLWSQTYDRKLTDVFAVQDDIAGAVVDALKLKLLPAERPSTAKHHVPDFETYDHYLLGRQLLVRNDTNGHVRAIEAFRQAVAQDRQFAAAYAGLAMAESFAVENSDLADRQPGQRRAMAAAEQAVALDPALGDAFAARGYLRGTNDWDWDGALADLTKAVALDPADPKNQLRYGYLLATLGRLPDAITALEQSIKAEPLFTPAWYWLGRVKAAQKDYEGARLALRRALAIDPDYRTAEAYLGIVTLLEGDAATARDSFAKLKRPFGLSLAEHDLGHAAEAKQALDQFIAQHAQDGAYQIAAAYAWRGDYERAFDWFEQAIAGHDVDLVLIKYDPVLRGLRDDPRYGMLLRELKLPE